MKTQKLIVEKITLTVSRLIESKMRVWEFQDKLESIADNILKNKESILANGIWKEYIINETYRIYVANYDTFVRTYPNQKNSGGFMISNCVVFWLNETYSKEQLLLVLLHEFEHAIDYKENRNNIVDMNQQQLLSLGYDVLYNPDDSTDPDVSKLKTSIQWIIYRLWVTTEKNAFASYALMPGWSIESYVNYLKNLIDYVNSVDADKYASIWFSVAKTITQRKNSIDMRKVVPKAIKKHFVNQSYHKLKKYEENLIKKYRYAKMNGIKVGTLKTIFPPIPKTE